MPAVSSHPRPPPIRIEPFEGYKNVRGPLDESSISEKRGVLRLLFLLTALGVIAALVLLALLFG